MDRPWGVAPGRVRPRNLPAGGWSGRRKHNFTGDAAIGLSGQRQKRKVTLLRVHICSVSFLASAKKVMLALFSILETQPRVLNSTLYHPIPQLHSLSALRDFRQSLLCENQEQVCP